MKINQISPGANKFTQITEYIALVPKMLYYIGTLPNERRPAVAIVGSCKPTVYGREVTSMLAGKLTMMEISGIVRGLSAN